MSNAQRDAGGVAAVSRRAGIGSASHGSSACASCSVLRADRVHARGGFGIARERRLDLGGVVGREPPIGVAVQLAFAQGAGRRHRLGFIGRS